jgi:hypothetical protein
VDRPTQRILLLRGQSEFIDAAARCPNDAAGSASKRIPTKTGQLLPLSEGARLKDAALKNAALHFKSQPDGFMLGDENGAVKGRRIFMCFGATEG